MDVVNIEYYNFDANNIVDRAYCSSVYLKIKTERFNFEYRNNGELIYPLDMRELYLLKVKS